MGDNLLEWDQIFRSFAIGLEFAPTIIVGFYFCWISTEKHIVEQISEIAHLEMLINHERT